MTIGKRKIVNGHFYADGIKKFAEAGLVRWLSTDTAFLSLVQSNRRLITAGPWIQWGSWCLASHSLLFC